MRRISTIALVSAAMLTGTISTIAWAEDLDARLEALERENAVLKKRIRIEALERENAALKKRLNLATPVATRLRTQPTISLPAHSSDQAIAGAYAMASGVSVSPSLLPNWTGLYFGASFGFARLKAQETDSSIFSSSSFNSYDLGFSFGQNQYSSQNFGTATLRGAHLGGLGTLFLGGQTMIGNQLVLGLQLEGGLSNIQARLTGINATTSTSSSYSTSTSICPACVPPNPTSTSISNSTSSGVNRVADSLATRWLASALARGGFLIGPTDLIYAIGGYTYAGFETPQNNSSFGLNGGTIGGGYERRISPLWSIRAEYRYTKFQGKTVDLPYTSTGTSTGGGQTSTNSSNNNNAAHFTADIQAVFVGVSRSFD